MRDQNWYGKFSEFCDNYTNSENLRHHVNWYGKL